MRAVLNMGTPLGPGPIRVCERGYGSFRESAGLEAQFPGITLLGDCVNRGHLAWYARALSLLLRLPFCSG